MKVKWPVAGGNALTSYHHANRGRPAEALAHYRWVKEHGTTTFVEYGIAVAELDRLDAAAKPAKP